MDPLDPRICYAALRARDERFDGRFFVGVTSTRIYCRPICPARPAKRANCRFFPSAAGARSEGFRPCLRCRPETAPQSGAWRGTSSTVARAMALIAEGALDGDEGVDDLAERLGVGGRHLRRLFQQHVGATPIAAAQTARLHLAKQLLHDTRLPMTEVAQAAGFRSLRRFNEVFRDLYGRPPTQLRRETTSKSAPEATPGVTVELRYRPPYDWAAVLAHLRHRAVEGVEATMGDAYVRILRVDGAVGVVEVTHRPERRALVATLRLPAWRTLAPAIGRLRRAFDLNADPEAIEAHLGADPLLRPLVLARPGLRVPGAFDPFELAVRAVLGQQITVQSARRLAGDLVRLTGRPVDARATPLTHAFPNPVELAGTDLSSLRMPGARKRTLLRLAEAVAEDPTLLEPRPMLDATVERLTAIPGIGPWTAQYIALRALHEPDAFPASDAGLLRGAAVDGARPTPGQLRARAEPWRPFRAYAAQHLWAASGDPAFRPKERQP